MNIHDLIPKVEGVFLALLEEKDNAEYAVYLVNDRKDIMEGIIVTSVGFGENLQSGRIRHRRRSVRSSDATRVRRLRLCRESIPVRKVRQ